MSEILKNIKELFSWIWRPAKTAEEKTIKRYDVVISLCIMFMVGYSGVYILKLESKIETNAVTISNVESTDPNYHPSLYFAAEDKSLYPQYTTNSLTNKEFYIGEIVGVRYFGIFGLVRDKTLGVNGYVYTVRYENAEHDLMSDEFFAWELYRPAPGSVPISVLRQ